MMKEWSQILLLIALLNFLQACLLLAHMFVKRALCNLFLLLMLCFNCELEVLQRVMGDLYLLSGKEWDLKFSISLIERLSVLKGRLVHCFLEVMVSI